MKSKLLSLSLLFSFLVAALAIASWESKFFPRNRTEIEAPASGKSRAFTYAYGFIDGSIILCASDWPQTFSKPAEIGDIYSEGFPDYHLHWSNDGSVLALRVVLGAGKPELFQSAYDFKLHALTRAAQPSDFEESDRKITSLLQNRGGIGPLLTGIDDGKLTSYKERFPMWCWIAPLALVALGVVVSRRVWRRSKAFRQ